MEGDLDVVHRDWPKDRLPQTFIEPTTGLGRAPVRRINLGSPPAGTVFPNVKNTSRNMWVVKWIQLRYAPDANVANRIIHVRFRNANADEYAQWLPTVVHTAAQGTIDFSGPSPVTYDIGSTRSLVGPDYVVMLPDDVVVFTVDGIQVGDTMRNGVLTVEQIPIPEGVS